jgi:hypothetical protein
LFKEVLNAVGKKAVFLVALGGTPDDGFFHGASLLAKDFTDTTAKSTPKIMS